METPLYLAAECTSICGVLKPRCEMKVLACRDAFRDALVAWFLANAKDYPWRRTHDAYEVLVSEIMLQQTQIATVLGKGYYARFLAAFPDVQTLSLADDETLLKAWEGLGYYRRARMLRETARAVVTLYDGVFPADVDLLMKLPGIGRYTAGALRAFVFNQSAVLVDGNVARVIARLMNYHVAVDMPIGQKQIWQWAGELADDQRPRPYHAALMELGQTICRPGAADCLNCPVGKFCACVEPAALPLKKHRAVLTAVDEHAVWLRDEDGRVLVHREAGNRRAGLWKLPIRDGAQIAHLPVLAEHAYGITRYKVTLRVHDGARLRGQSRVMAGDEWKTPEEIVSLAMAAPFRRVLEQLLADF